MGQSDDGRKRAGETVRVGDILVELEGLEATVDSSEERAEVRRVKRMLERVPGRRRIQKYTSRDVAEGFVGGIVFSLPLLVEDGVFEIAEWFVDHTIGGIPIFLVLNVLFIGVLIGGLLYFTDIRNIAVRPIFGFIPKRMVAILTISFIVAAAMMYMWGRLHAEDPTQVEQLARITVIWAASALGATLGDILPGESRGQDLSEMVTERSEPKDES